MMEKQVLDEIEALLGSKIVDCRPVAGGSVSRTNKLVLQNARIYFVKSGVSKIMLDAEAEGLSEIRKCGCVKVPQVVALGSSFMVMEWIEKGRRGRDFFKVLGRQLAMMHRYGAEAFGFKSDNFIGSTPQYNVPVGSQSSEWAVFYMDKRLRPQFDMARANGYVDGHMERLFERISQRLPDLLDGSSETPSLLHGDLWGGNYMVGSLGEPVLIDPAVYYGHREADLAMTKLFGGFDADFYSAYEHEWPLEKGSKLREPVYLLYHVLNHLNLFGSSYRWQSIELMERVK